VRGQEDEEACIVVHKVCRFEGKADRVVVLPLQERGHELRVEEGGH